MSHNTSFRAAIYNPPRLPTCLSEANSLKTIVGVPSNEEVKAIHAATRAVNGILSAPALYDPDLPMQLAQHLFEVQMALYRSTYGPDDVPDTTYNPPILPSHIPVSLEPVVGAPSDEEIKLVQSAVRAVESLSNSPAIFDPDLSMNLSQHLFNLQNARYIQHSAKGTFTSGSTQPPSNEEDIPSSIPMEAESRTLQAGDSEPLVDVQTDPALAPVVPGTANGDTVETRELTPVTPAHYNVIKLDETNRVLERIEGILQDVSRTLMSTQRCLRAHSKSRPLMPVNDKGELPSAYNLSNLSTNNSNSWQLSGLSDGQIAQYLKFYDIGADFIDDRHDRVKLDKRSNAEEVLKLHLSKDF